MTLEEVKEIASKLDAEMRKKITEEVNERLEILKEADLEDEELEQIEECLYVSLVVQEYLTGAYEVLEEERDFLLEEMKEMFNEYGELLTKAKLEEKLSKKKRMALELMRIRQELLRSREIVSDMKVRMNKNKDDRQKLSVLSSKDTMQQIVKESKKETVIEKNTTVEKKSVISNDNTKNHNGNGQNNDNNGVGGNTGSTKEYHWENINNTFKKTFEQTEGPKNGAAHNQYIKELVDVCTNNR